MSMTRHAQLITSLDKQPRCPSHAMHSSSRPYTSTQDVHDTPCTAHHVPRQATKMSMTRHAQLITSLDKHHTPQLMTSLDQHQDVHDTPCTAHHVASESNDK
eukprot:g70760.t1